MPTSPSSPTGLNITIPPVLSHMSSSSSLNKPTTGNGGATIRERRGRSGSLVEVQEVASTEQDILDQSAWQNLNPEWVNGKGAWVIHPFLVLAGKVMIDSIPGMTQPLSWTICNLSYCMVSYLMFHYVTGTPFGSSDHSGAYDDLTMWEQIDEGAQYTPAKKWLTSMPIGLFLISTHYTQYDPWAFAINVTSLLLVLVPKLPQMHRQRVRFMPMPLTEPPTPSMSRPMTPVASSSPIGGPGGMANGMAFPPPPIVVSESDGGSGRSTPVGR